MCFHLYTHKVNLACSSADGHLHRPIKNYLLSLHRVKSVCMHVCMFLMQCISSVYTVCLLECE